MTIAGFALAAALAQGASVPPPEPPPAAADGSGIIAYPAAFFADQLPNNASEMLQRLPGFSYSGGAAVRGFAGAAGNVLIDGERPSSKAVSLDEVLKRIPANTVERIELIRGGAPGIDMQGHPVVANVVRRREALGSTAVSLGLRTWKTGWLAPLAVLEVSRRYGFLRLDGTLQAFGAMNYESGDGRLDTYTPAAVLIQGGPLRNRKPGKTFAGSGSAELDRGADVWRLNIGGSDQEEDTRETVQFSNAAGLRLGDQFLTDHRNTRRYEIGGDYAHVFNEGLSTRLVALQSIRTQTFNAQSTAAAGTSTSGEESKTGESILRATLTAQPWAALTIESGGEAAFNFLDVASSFTSNGVVQVLPNANLRVEERRAEGFVTGFLKPMTTLSLEAGMRVEASRISQTGDTRLSRTFVFAKPRAVLSWTVGDNQVRLKAERTVGQLDFRSFAASATLGGGEVNAGNAQLEPEREWAFEAAYERRFWGKGALVLTYAHAWVEQTLDYVPVTARLDALGNIGPGRRDVAKVNLSLPLDRFLLKRGQLVSEGVWRWSEVTDAITGLSRPISSDIHFTGTFRLSQDIPSLKSTWGLIMNFGYPQTQYRISEIRRVSWESFWFLNWDWKPRPDLTIHAEVQDATSRDYYRYRTQFSGRRSLGVVNAVEVRRSRNFPTYILRVRKVL